MAEDVSGDLPERSEAADSVPLTSEIAFEPQVIDPEDIQAAVGTKDLGAPTAKEVAQHELTHLPHRSWCAACVAGRSRNKPHKKLSGRDLSLVPCVVFDCVPR